MNIRQTGSNPAEASRYGDGRFHPATWLAVLATVAVGIGLVGCRAEETGLTANEPPVDVDSGPATTGPGGHVTSRYEWHTVFITDSEQLAGEIAVNITEAEAIRWATVAPGVRDEVIFVDSAEAAGAVLAAELERNTILVEEYGVENRIVDLRGHQHLGQEPGKETRPSSLLCRHSRWYPAFDARMSGW